MTTQDKLINEWTTPVLEEKKRMEQQTQQERDLQALKDWWVDLATEEFNKVGPKAIEYGAYDLQEIGRTLAYTMKRYDLSPAEAAEMGIYFYVIGKIGRWTDAIATGKQVSDDTLHDIGVYIRMAQRIRTVGAWPFLPEEEKGEDHHPACEKYGDDSQCDRCNR